MDFFAGCAGWPSVEAKLLEMIKMTLAGQSAQRELRRGITRRYGKR